MRDGSTSAQSGCVAAATTVDRAAGVVFEHLSFSFDEHQVLRDVSFRLPRGQTVVLLGASGSGKSVLLKLILGLLKPDSGSITVNGRRIEKMSEADLMTVRAEVGMVFQENALFDSLTVAENVGYRLYEETRTPHEQVRRRSTKCSDSSAWRSTSTGCRRSSPEGSAGAWRSLAPWRHDRTCSSSTIRPQASIRSSPRRSTTRSGAHDVDLIVLASHRVDLSMAGRDWGTISYKVGLLAQCPVLLVK